MPSGDSRDGAGTRMAYESATRLIICAITPLQSFLTASPGDWKGIALQAGIAIWAAEGQGQWQGRRASHLPPLHEPCCGACV